MLIMERKNYYGKEKLAKLLKLSK